MYETAFRLKLTADDFMSDLSPLTPIIDRGIALHKMIRYVQAVRKFHLTDP